MDIEALGERAAAALPAPVAEYFNQGAGAGVSTAEAATAWAGLRLRPRVLRDVSSVSTATTVLGQALTTPILVAPTTLQRLAHPDGEAATAAGAAAAGSLMCVSSNSGTDFATIGAVGPWWLQAYVLRDRGLTRVLLDRARAAGAVAVVLTADTPVVGRKHNAGGSVWTLASPEHLLVNVDHHRAPDGALDKADDLTPRDIAWLAEITGLPIVVKGVLRADDARDCAAAGAAAVWVSNHGGRQLDLAVPTAVALPEVAAALAGTGVEVYVDGGLRRAEHILAALALGAQAVFLGRPILWALATGGAGGVGALLSGLTDELAHAMTLAGVKAMTDLSPDLVRLP